jgi:plastocyanin
MVNRVRVAEVLVVAAVFVAACGSGPAPAGTSVPETQAAGASSEVPVSVSNFAFDPQSVTVKVGATVRWTNQDSARHTITSDAGDWDSGSLSQGQSYSHTFTQEGTFTYHCTVHPSMTGTVVVTP